MTSSNVIKPPFTHTPTAEDYKNIATATLGAFGKANRDFDFINSLTPPGGVNFSWTHGDGPPTTDPKEFIARFTHFVTNIAPDFDYQVKDSVAELVKDERGEVVGGKVWLFGVISGTPKERESVDMLEMDAKGYWIGGKDVQRDIGSDEPLTRA